MQRTIAARMTMYKKVRFRSRLEARWAAFFDRLKWEWWYEPIDFERWVPDFSVQFKCEGCERSHKLYAEVKPYESMADFTKHPVLTNDFGKTFGLDGSIALGLNPSVSRAGLECSFLMKHEVLARCVNGDIPDEWIKDKSHIYRPAEGIELFADWSAIEANHILDHWSAAGNTVQWIPK